jgi:tRNA (cmo5U34)-methyltransferase
MKIRNDWTFKAADVAEGFDAHVREQLPWYDLTTGIVAHIARHYIPEGGLVYDIGASTGNIGNCIRDTLVKRNATLVAIDNAEEMRAIYQGPDEFIVCNAEDFDFKEFDLAICFLCLMFLSAEKRANLIKKLCSKIKLGGAVIIFDKMIPSSGYPATILFRLALAGKISAGASASDVVAKELSISGIQRPLSMSELPDHSVEIFRFGDFAGFIIERK